MFMLLSEEHPKNAKSTILVTEDGMSILLREMQLLYLQVALYQQFAS